ncbi:hypothetical protein F4780DRAFT_560743 [Xylariomycetidae sp. FL0641]|nr:hypothetical protein F4780DRAFT_560743 [Xylariomycetidae sp. FL0641]
MAQQEREQEREREREQEPRWTAVKAQPTLGEGGSATLACAATIAAPPEACVEVVLDAANYPSWNRWVQKVVVHSSEPGLLRLGSEFDFQVHMDPDSAGYNTTGLVLTVLDRGYQDRDGRSGVRVAWKTRGDAWYMRAERTQEFVRDADGNTAYSCYETFYGPVSWLVKTLVGAKLVRGYKLWVSGLKEAAASKAAAS